MLIFTSTASLQTQLNNFKQNGKKIGFVPTMGALHQGHISLITNTLKDCDVVICSIFVNPTQFNDIRDLEKYPRTWNEDIRLLEIAKCTVVFAPTISEMYTEQELALKQQHIEDKSWALGKPIDFGILDKVMEEIQRPGHFNGMAQIVTKLLRIVEPDIAYFGQKDFQQLAIVRSLVKQLSLPVEIIACDIVREKDGLAMSSRNTRLSVKERAFAPAISKCLFKIKELASIKTVIALKNIVIDDLKQIPEITLEYVEIVDALTLQSITDFKQTKSAVACIAVKLGEVRLIDNVILYS
ncbi:MAG: pantoate--beta-alanine ligase [Bacteroidia bacterium]